ncbi:MAG: prolipoprotein diacylglyceryl transferase [Deltaproteobacteria bacterium]|nr:prolipoprotein diacylglyceryl transferase [Deltaproteobacteria bacterium]
MHPILFKIPIFGGIPIATYGLLVAVAFLIGNFWVRYESKRLGDNPETASDLIFWIILSGLAGSRMLYHNVAEPSRYFSKPLVFFKFWEGGLVFYGGFIAAAIGGSYFCYRHRLRVLKYFDIVAPALSLGHAVGRVGCFFAGCCFGRPTHDHPWYAVIFPEIAEGRAPAGIPLYPTQLMESGAELIIFGFLLWLRLRKKFDGQIFVTYVMLYAIVRSIIEIFRGDLDRGFIIDPWLSTSQFISLILFLIGAFIYWAKWSPKISEGKHL